MQKNLNVICWQIWGQEKNNALIVRGGLDIIV